MYVSTLYEFYLNEHRKRNLEAFVINIVHQSWARLIQPCMHLSADNIRRSKNIPDVLRVQSQQRGRSTTGLSIKVCVRSRIRVNHLPEDFWTPRQPLSSTPFQTNLIKSVSNKYLFPFYIWTFNGLAPAIGFIIFLVILTYEFLNQNLKFIVM